MTDFKMGRVVFSDRGYIVAEMLVQGTVVGFSLIGTDASSSIIYSSRNEALEALQDIEARVSGS